MKDSNETAAVLGGVMERVVFDVPAAGDLAVAMAGVRGRAEQIEARIRQLDRPAWGEGLDWGDPFGQRLSGTLPSGTIPSGTGHLGQVVEWAVNAADDLRWRLGQIRATDQGLPPVVSHRLPDGRIEAGFPLRDQHDDLAWRTGMGLHGDLVAALDDIDGARADLLLDDLAAAVDDPMVLAGFASMLGAHGLADMVDRIEQAKARDPRWDTMAEWFGGSNPRWDSLKAELATIAASAGGLASYGADDRVAGNFVGGGVVIATMEHLLMTHPMVLAGKWSEGTDLSRSRFAELGGVPVELAPLGSNVVGPDRLLVTRVEGTPGQAFHWDDDLGRLQAVDFEMPSTWNLVGQTASSLAHDPGAAIVTAWENPDQAAMGFLIGASATVAVAYGWTYLVGQGVVGVGGSAAGSTGAATWATASGTQVAAAGSMVSGAWNARSVIGVGQEFLTPGPCRAERVVASAGQAVGAGGVGSAFGRGGMFLTSTAFDVGSGVLAIPVDCERHQ